jgi:hypothetical protein
MRRPILSASFASGLSGCLALLLFLQCVSQQEILGERESSAPSAGAGGTGLKDCYAALARGTDGEPCVGSFSCSSVPRACCAWSAVCANGSLRLSEECGGCACETDADCPSSSWCVAHECVPCSILADCAFPEVGVPRNGCTWCVLLGECAKDADCRPGTICYAGMACPPGCSSPSCCFGNLCDAPGCGSTEDVDCSLVGCADSGACQASERPDCACTNGRWTCSSDSRNACVAL